MSRTYRISEPKGGWRDISAFSDVERQKLRPMAETFAMLDGNAFFGNTVTFEGREYEWWEQYLCEAHAVYEGNGGDNGWAGEASFVQEKP